MALYILFYTIYTPAFILSVQSLEERSIRRLLKANSTEGSYCESPQLRALIVSGPFFPDVLPRLGLKWLTLPTDTAYRQHAKQQTHTYTSKHSKRHRYKRETEAMKGNEKKTKTKQNTDAGTNGCESDRRIKA